MRKDSKRCSKCKIESFVIFFRKDKKTKDEFYKQCKSCRTEYYNGNLGKIRKYNLGNRGGIKECQLKNHEKFLLVKRFIVVIEKKQILLFV